MNQKLSKHFVLSHNDELARQCLSLIRDIADRGALAQDSIHIGYALQELTQVLIERTGTEDILFEPVKPTEIADLRKLYIELDLVNCSAQDLMRGTRFN